MQDDGHRVDTTERDRHAAVHRCGRARDAGSVGAERHCGETVATTGGHRDLRQHLARPDRRQVNTEKEVGCRHGALATCPGNRHLRTERRHQRRQVVRGVARAEVAADRAAIANLHVGDLRADLTDDRPRPRFARFDELGVRRHGADLERSVGAELDALQLLDRGQVDERIGRARARLHHVDQGLAAGEGACTVVGRQQLDRFPKRSRPRISDLTKKHPQYVL